jgi:hypothetical protein
LKELCLQAEGISSIKDSDTEIYLTYLRNKESRVIAQYKSMQEKVKIVKWYIIQISVAVNKYLNQANFKKREKSIWLTISEVSVNDCLALFLWAYGGTVSTS